MLKEPQTDEDGGDRLRRVVVELAGNSLSLLFVRSQYPRGHLLDLAVVGARLIDSGAEIVEHFADEAGVVTLGATEGRPGNRGGEGAVPLTA